MTDQVHDIAKALRLEVRDRFVGGEFGAYDVTTSSGERAVLKLLYNSLADVERAVHFVEAIREEGYPAPRFLDVGETRGATYSLQEFVSGRLAESLSESQLLETIELSAMHQGIAERIGRIDGHDPTEAIGRARSLACAVLDGELPLEVRPLIARGLEICSAADPTELRRIDLCHGDFHARNLLVDDDRVVAVFDWEGCEPGDWRADLLRLCSTSISISTADQRWKPLLQKRVREHIPDPVRALLGAIRAIGDLEYAIRTVTPLPWAIRNARVLLEDFL